MTLSHSILILADQGAASPHLFQQPFNNDCQYSRKNLRLNTWVIFIFSDLQCLTSTAPQISHFITHDKCLGLVCEQRQHYIWTETLLLRKENGMFAEPKWMACQNCCNMNKTMTKLFLLLPATGQQHHIVSSFHLLFLFISHFTCVLLSTTMIYQFEGTVIEVILAKQHKN